MQPTLVCATAWFFFRDMVHFILIIMMSLPGPPVSPGIFNNPWWSVKGIKVKHVKAKWLQLLTKGRLVILEVVYWPGFGFLTHLYSLLPALDSRFFLSISYGPRGQGMPYSELTGILHDEYTLYRKTWTNTKVFHIHPVRGYSLKFRTHPLH